MFATFARLAVLACLALAAGGPVLAAARHPRDVLTSDIPPNFKPDQTAYDYTRREAMIPMRDGVKLHAVIVVPKAARRPPCPPMSR